MEKIPENSINFYTSLGVCIAAWSKVEDGLFNIFHLAMRCDKKLAAIVFYRTPTIDLRLKLTDEIVCAALPKPKRANGGHNDPLVVEWKKISVQITAIVPERNAMAHNEVRRNFIVYGSPSHDKQRIDGPYFEIVESSGELLRGRGSKIPKLYATNLMEHKEKVDKLWQRLTAFRRALAKQL